MLNSRELAALLWLIALAVWGATKPGVRESAIGIFQAATRPKLLAVFALFGAWIALLVLVAWRIGLWHPGMWKDTLLWSLGPALVLLINSAEATKGTGFFRRTVISLVEFTVVIELFLNLFVLPLLLELVLQPLLLVLLMLSVLAPRETDLTPVKRTVDCLFVLIGAGLTIYVTLRVVREWEQIDLGTTIRQFVLPIWLTLGALPFVYALGLYGAYELAFTWIDRETTSTRERLRAKLALVAGLRLRARDVRSYSIYHAGQTAGAASLREAFRIVLDHRSAESEKRRKKAEETRRLEENAGLTGVDAEGRQLDQREFKETREALQFLATAQMGWYRNLGGRYRPDLLEVVEASLEAEGLPPDHGIQMEVADDGQSWYAWRRTITGWCFGIGAAEPPPDQWLYDGPEPPDQFPPGGPEWCHWGQECANW